MLLLGTMYAPTQDRGVAGEGFTQHLGDIVTITAPEIGSCVNVVDLSTNCPEWTFGAADLMRNLAARNLL